MGENLEIMWMEWLGNIVAGLISGSIGAGVVYYFGIRQLAKQRRSDFRKQQLAEFYAPLAGMRKRILAHSNTRLKVSRAAEAAWRQICDSYRGGMMADVEERYAPFKSIIEYENRQFESEMLPVYREMLHLFADRYGLADADTREYYQELVEFVEIWNRWMAKALPAEVLEQLTHGEENVLPFYDHVESKVGQLQSEILAG